MIDRSSRWMLADPTSRPQGGRERIELAAAIWLETLIDRVERAWQWCIARPLMTFVVWSLWLSFLYFALGPWSYIKVPDCGNGTLPARIIEAQNFVNGQLGNWMDYSGCGTDRVLNNFRLEPHCVLFGFLPTWLAYGLITLAQRFVAGYFFFRVTRDDLKFHATPAMLTGLAYSLFHQRGIHWQWDGFTFYDGFGIPCLPLLFWLTNRLHERNWLLSLAGGLIMGLALGLSAAYFQTVFFPFLAIFWYSFLQGGWTWKRLALLTFVFVGWAIVSAPEMYAAAQYVPLSHRQEIVVRSDSPYVKYIENVQFWPKAVWYANRPYLILAAIGLIGSRLRERRVLLTCLAVFGILSFVSHYHFFNDHIFSHLGILSCFHFHRFIYLVPFLCALAMGFGLMAVPANMLLTLNTPPLRIDLTRLSPLAGALVLVWLSWDVNLDRWKQLWRGENYTSLYRHPDLLALAERKETEPDFRVACVSDMWRPALGMAESHRWSPNPGVAWAYGLETTDGYQVLYSLRYKQFWSAVLERMFEHDKVRKRQHIYWGNMVYLWYPSITEMDEPLREYYDLELLSLTNTKYIISPEPLIDRDLKLLPSPQRRDLLEWDDRHSTKRALGALRGEWSFRPLYIYQNKRCLPRFFLVPNVQMYADAEELQGDLTGRSVDWFKHYVAVASEDVPAGVDLTPLTDHRHTLSADSIGDVRVIKRTSDHLELEFEAAQPCMLFLSHTHHPGWGAQLDDQPTPIVPVNLAFQGIYIPAAGNHRVKLDYQANYRLLK